MMAGSSSLGQPSPKLSGTTGSRSDHDGVLGLFHIPLLGLEISLVQKFNTSESFPLCSSVFQDSRFWQDLSMSLGCGVV
jgi:hypothetical protein